MEVRPIPSKREKNRDMRCAFSLAPILSAIIVGSVSGQPRQRPETPQPSAPRMGDQKPERRLVKEATEETAKAQEEVDKWKDALVDWIDAMDPAQRALDAASDSVCVAAKRAAQESADNARRVANAPRGAAVRLNTAAYVKWQMRLQEQKQCRRQVAKCVRGQSVAYQRLKVAKKALDKAIAGAEGQQAGEELTKADPRGKEPPPQDEPDAAETPTETPEATPVEPAPRVAKSANGGALTSANYDRVEVGMSRKQVEAILGVATDEVISGEKMLVLAWEGGHGASALITFRNGKVTAKGRCR